MKKLTIVMMTLVLSVSILSMFNPQIVGLSLSDSVFMSCSAIIIPIARFSGTFFWEFLILPFYNRTKSTKAKHLLKTMFLPIGK
jgi:hypothetical protein